MIIYSNDIQSFISQCDQGIISIILSEKMKACSMGNKPSETTSWESSLPEVAKALKKGSIESDVCIAIEYRFDMNDNRVDCLIYGLNDNNQESVVIIELKQWSSVKSTQKRNYVFTYGGRGMDEYEHPSYQSLRYKRILEDFNEYIQDNSVTINACSYLHNMDCGYSVILSDYSKYPYVDYVPVFYENDEEKLADFIKRFVKKGKSSTLYTIDNARIRPSKNFSNLFVEALQGNEIFTLDDDQAYVVSEILSEVNWALDNNKRRTIIVKGGPGTGKSIVAISAMGLLLHPSDGSDPKNVCYCTPNHAPRTLYSEILVDNDYKKVAIKNLFKSMAFFPCCREFEFDCIFMDEAHRMLPWKFGHNVKRDVDEIERSFNASRVNVWFIDEDQAVTKNDYLTIGRIRDYARKFNSDVIETEDLHLTAQFRCVGGRDYISFIRDFLGYNEKATFKPNNYDFQIFDSPSKMWDAIRIKQNEYPRSRLLAGYTHDWKSRGDETPDAPYDFEMEEGQFKMRWNKFVSNAYINDPTQSENIGCIHTVQGVDMDYAGVIIGKDLLYRDGMLLFDKKQNAKTDRDSGIRTVDDDLAERLIRNTYMVLLTRGRYGTFIYCEDEALNRHLKEKWNNLKIRTNSNHNKSCPKFKLY